MSERDGEKKLHLNVDRLAAAMDAARTRKPTVATSQPVISDAGDAKRSMAAVPPPEGPVGLSSDAPLPPLILTEPTTTPDPPDRSSSEQSRRRFLPSSTSFPAPFHGSQLVQDADIEPVPPEDRVAARIAELEALIAEDAPVAPALAEVTVAEDSVEAVVPFATRRRPDLASVGPSLLSLSGIRTDIGSYHILDGVDLEVPSGGVTMLLGRNGVGKTTTLRTIMGLWKPRSGKVMFAGQNIAGRPTSHIARSGIGYVPEDMGVFGKLTVAENMALGAVSGRIPNDRLAWIFRTFPPLKTFWRSQAGTLSGGQKQMLSIARAMVEKRRLYLIDEPTKGLAPAIVATLAGALRDLKLQGATILMVEQNFAMAKALGDTCVVMEDGRCTWRGLMEELAEDADLQRKLLGLATSDASAS